jgi:DNA-binding NarL/FixJ family response regulator
MKQISIVLAFSSPALHAKMRAELLLHPELEILYDAKTPAEAIAQTRLRQPQIVLCDRGMLADGQMNAIAQQARVVSLLVLVSMGDECLTVRVPVPVAAVIPSSHRPGELAERLRAVIDAPSSFTEPGVRLSRHLAPPSERLDLAPMNYDPGRIPSLPRSGRLSWLSDRQAEDPSPLPTGAEELTKIPFMKSVFDPSGENRD